MYFKNLFVIILTILLSFIVFPNIVKAQEGFAGSNVNNYQCGNYGDLSKVNSKSDLTRGEDFLALISQLNNYISEDDVVITDSGDAVVVDNNGNYVCVYEDENGEIVIKNAIPQPPTLRVVQVWFVRLIYVIWGISGVTFTAGLVWIGFKYLTSFGNDYAVGGVIKDFRKWLVGLILVFLSYPALNTFYRILPLSDSACFSDINVIGFQFFFPEACEVSSESSNNENPKTTLPDGTEITQ